MSEKIVLIDGHSILNRAFFGLPDLTNSAGRHTGAVYGFLNILFKILEEEQPDYLTVAFDVHAPTFRHQMYDGYKGTRKPMAQELREQVPLMKEMLTAMGVSILECEGYEADDVLGTIAGMGERNGMEVSIVSGDRDLLQLATDHVKIRIPKTKRTGTEIEDYLAADVKERYLVTPHEFIDVKALMGDASDNIPGVPGIGEKTATALIAQYGSIEEVHAHVDAVKPPRAAKNIVEFWDQAVMSKELATICTEAPISYSLADAKLDGIASLYTKEAYLLCKELDFKNLLGRFSLDFSQDFASSSNGREKRPEDFYRLIQSHEEFAEIRRKAEGKPLAFYMLINENAGRYIPSNTDSGIDTDTSKETNISTDSSAGESAFSGSYTESDGQMSLFDCDFNAQAERSCSSSQDSSPESISTEQNIYGMSVCFGEFDTYLILTGDEINCDELRTWVNEPGIRITADLKRQLPYLNIVQHSYAGHTAESGSDMIHHVSSADSSITNANTRGRFFDRTIAAYLLNPLKGDYPYEDIAKDELGTMLPSRADLLGKQTLAQAIETVRASQIAQAAETAQTSQMFQTAQTVQTSDLTQAAETAQTSQMIQTAQTAQTSDLTQAAEAAKTSDGPQVSDKAADSLLRYACHEAYVSWKSQPILQKKLSDAGMKSLFIDMEMPLVFILSDMEQEGICMNADALREYAAELSVSITALEGRIHEQAGERFNINSPKQLGVILFEKLGLPNGKKTKTGYSTSADVLEKLAPDYPIVKDILEYRQLTKLKSTYADGLPAFVQEDGRIHATLHQTITATGRLSCSDPNLQNIPIRIELGHKIRKAFHPKPGYVFVDSDYSQIELRVLAHMSGDEQLIEAFRNHQDIHRTTASQVFHVPFDEVTPLQRRNAKAVNFGIVYGISAFGLAQDLDISRKEAQDYIDRYFATYPKIKEFLDRAVAEAKENGSIRTLFGRIRPIPELSSSNFMQRQFGERVAMNSPIQGTAADIIKIAMIRVHDRLLAEGLKSRLILQIHDELLVETAEDEQEQVIRILEEEMPAAAQLSVELEVDTNVGDTWYDAH